jgi:hypothetical protein
MYGSGGSTQKIDGNSVNKASYTDGRSQGEEGLKNKN